LKQNHDEISSIVLSSLIYQLSTISF